MQNGNKKFSMLYHVNTPKAVIQKSYDVEMSILAGKKSMR